MKYTIKNLAKKFNISEAGIRVAIYNRKTLPYEKVGGKIYIKEEDYISYKEKKGIKSISEDEISQWYNDFCLNLTFKDISKKYNRAESTISKFLKEKYNATSKSYHERLPKEILDLYKDAYNDYITENKKSLSQVIKDYNIEYPHRFTHYLRRCGFKLKSLSEVSNYTDNENFFENIDSEIKAYLLGFFAADGHIEKRKDYDSYTLRVGVQLDDYHVLKLYTNYISKKTIISCKENLASIAITNKKIGEDLLNLGYDNLKTYNCKSIPNLKENLIHHFIRGYFDGDGCIIIRARRAGKRLSGFNREFNIVCHNKEVLEAIKDKIPVNCYISRREGRKEVIKEREVVSSPLYSLYINKKEDLKKMYHYLYNDATFYFKRKKDKFKLSFLEVNEIEAALQGNL